MKKEIHDIFVSQHLKMTYMKEQISIWKRDNNSMKIAIAVLRERIDLGKEIEKLYNRNADIILSCCDGSIATKQVIKNIDYEKEMAESLIRSYETRIKKNELMIDIFATDIIMINNSMNSILEENKLIEG